MATSIARALFVPLVLLWTGTFIAHAQSLDEELKQVPLARLVTEARDAGDAARGAIVFHQPQMACSKCHVTGRSQQQALGPDLTSPNQDVTDESLIESVLFPSKVIRKGFQSVTVITDGGQAVTGLLVEETTDKLVLRDIARSEVLTTFNKSELDDWRLNDTSIMPAAQVNSLNSRQQFLDLIRYLMEIRDGGPVRALQLQPPASLLTFEVPEYEKHIDHVALIGDWNDESLARGEAIYKRVCMNCHGTLDEPGSLPTSLRFAEGRFKNGADPLSMYRTLTHGFGLMAPQTWMVPSQKYDVIHYIRDTYLRTRNPSQFVELDKAYLSKLPMGDTRGPEPSKIVQWSAMDYGPSLTHTYEVNGAKHNFAYKGIAIRLDPGAGGVSRGRHWMLFDHDTLRVSAAWSGSGKAEEHFIDWHGIQFDGEHGVHPHLVGKLGITNSTGPGWANPSTGDFVDDGRVMGRDGRRYGPLPRDWGRFRGLYMHDQDIVLSYSIGRTDVLEWPRLISHDDPETPAFARTFNIGPRDHELMLQVAELPSEDSKLVAINDAKSVVRFGPSVSAKDASDESKLTFDGNSFVEIQEGNRLDHFSKDFTIVARIKTRADGTIWSLCQPGPEWTPNGQTFFIRGGRLSFDVGWVGVVSGKTPVDDDRWHTVAMAWQEQQQRVRLFVDGRLDAEGKLGAKASLPKAVARIGFTAPDFPRPASFYQGSISEVRFYQKHIDTGLDDLKRLPVDEPSLRGRWLLAKGAGATVSDTTGSGLSGQVRHGGDTKNESDDPIVAGIAPDNIDAQWMSKDQRLILRIPAGEQPLRFTLWVSAGDVAAVDADVDAVRSKFKHPSIPDADRDLTSFTRGGPARWPQKLETRMITGADDGPFAADVLTAPDPNPWLAQMRFTGLDFQPNGQIAVCTWDGDVWLVEKVAESDAESPSGKLRWQRIASGMFQPLGLKVIDEKIHVICRDQLTVLHDLNGDREIDFYECLNNDHQVTEHFHEFAMGLQTDDEGNFYYAKSGCHGKEAVVPHHGTLLRVSKDGSTTEILANGFRAANGVCLNPDGSFVVTDQEGFWNPKNRINWVTVNPDGKPNFYGNMLGYHDITDTSDAAMIPPLCWITNAFDRSPAELLWVTSNRWGRLEGSLLNLSYGYGKVFVVPYEKVGDRMQGGMIELPVPAFPTGVMRGRFSPDDGQLYLCGMFAWAGNATQPGGLYRLRATGRPMHLPVQLHATTSGLKLTFSEPLDSGSLDPKNVQIKTWSLKRTANYGSKHYDEQLKSVRGLSLSADARTLTIEVDDLRPTWCMEIVYSFRSADGSVVQGALHNTIHGLGE